MKTSNEIKKGLELCASGCVDVLCEESLALIHQLEAQIPKWISVEDMLPEPFIPVLCFLEWGEALCCHYDGNGWVVNYDGEDAGPYYTITHWMPLPKPPEEASGNDA